MSLSSEAIYSTVPVDTDSSLESNRALKEFLEAFPGKFFKAKEIAKKCGFPERGTQVEVRKAITELVELRELPIVSNANGFGWAKHPNQVKFCIEALEQRKQGLQRRIDAYRRIHQQLLGNNYGVEQLDEYLQGN